MGNQWLAISQLGRAEPINTFPKWEDSGRHLEKRRRRRWHVGNVRLTNPASLPVPKERTMDGMHTMNASEAGDQLHRLVDETASNHEPLLIIGPRSSAVLVGEEDWNSIQETLHLLSVPGARESLIEGLATPVSECEKTPGW